MPHQICGPHAASHPSSPRILARTAPEVPNDPSQTRIPDRRTGCAAVSAARAVGYACASAIPAERLALGFAFAVGMHAPEYRAGFLDAIGAYLLTTLEGVLVDPYRWEVLDLLEREEN